MIEWVNKFEWVGSIGVGVAKDQAACTAYVQALANVRNSKNNLDDDLVALDAARIEAAQNGQDTSQLDAQRQNIVNAQAAAQAQIDDLTAKAADACQEVTPGPGPINTTCKTDGDCTSDYECVNGNCLPRCPAGWTRQADGTCAQATAAAKGTNWGIFALAGGAAVAIFLGFRASEFGKHPAARAQQHRRAA